MPLSSFLPGFSVAPPRYAGISEPSLFAALAHSTDPDARKGTDNPAEALEYAGWDGAPGGKHFDYIICGGGTAGCVLASRLTEDPKVSVLLVEAGESDQKVLFSRVPAGWANLFKIAPLPLGLLGLGARTWSSRVPSSLLTNVLSFSDNRTPADWAFLTVPQEHLSNRSLFQLCGKMLGGSSAINAQIYQHCSREDYDAWEAAGATGWGWDDLKPYFAKAEDFTPNPAHKIDESLRGKAGVWKTGYPPTSPDVEAWIKSGMRHIYADTPPYEHLLTPAVGVPHNPDLNIETNPNGITCFQATVDSSAPNQPGGPILSPEQRCVGVELPQNREGKTYVARATRDVIVCLAAFGTPQLLLCSGIGAKDRLNAAGVENKVDVPGVGEGLKDHLVSGIFFRAKSGTSFKFLKSQVRTLPSLLRWLAFGTGPLRLNLAEGGAFLRSETITRDGTVSTPTTATAHGIVDFPTNSSGATSADLEIIAAPVYHAMTPPPAPSANYFTMASTILKPFSSGTVGIRSGNVWDEPIIDPRFLSNERDQKVLLAGLHFLRRLSQTKPLSDFLIGVDHPAGGMQGFLDASDDQLLQHARNTAKTIYHPFCSARIGARKNGGVVDPSLRIYGTSNIRLCDASVFPNAVSGHPQAAVVAVAEKFADMLKAEQQAQPAA